MSQATRQAKLYEDKLLFNKEGQIASLPSTYKVPKHLEEINNRFMNDYELGYLNQTKSRREFNNRSLIQTIDEDRDRFNAYILPKSGDPAESWKAQTVRPITRNKTISFAAHLSSLLQQPSVFAQNETDDEDRKAARVMQRLLDYMYDLTDWERKAVLICVGALVNPAVFVEVDYWEAKKLKRSKNGDTTLTRDPVLSGPQINLISPENLMISNFRESELQRQRFVIRRKYIDTDELMAKYGTHDDVKYVQSGLHNLYYRPMGQMFSYTDDWELQMGVYEELIYYNRSLDLEVPVVNGVILEPERGLSMRREDGLYPFAKTGCEPIDDGNYFYYKSLVSKLAGDQDMMDTLYNMILDGTFLQLVPPVAIIGDEDDYDTSIIAPGTVSYFSEGAKVENIAPRMDLRGGMQAAQMVESSIVESSSSNMRLGIDSSSGTAREVSALERNAQIQLDFFLKNISFVVEDIGQLATGVITQHFTVMDVQELGGKPSEYRSYLIKDVKEDGKTKSEKIMFTTDEVSSMDVLEAEGGLDAEKKLSIVNPVYFSKMHYKTRIKADEYRRLNRAVEKALKIEVYDRAIQNPNVNQELITKEFLLETLAPGDSDRFMKKAQTVEEMAAAGLQAPGSPDALNRSSAVQQRGVNTSMLSQLTGSNSLSNAESQ